MYRRQMRGMYISKRALRKHFDPRERPRETYLLCELEWREGTRPWQHWVRNNDYKKCHAEQYFLEEIFEPRSYDICDMTWYLSYSPCWECCDVIQDFLEDQPNVNIEIHVARLYYVNIPRNCMALSELKSLQGVTIKAMEAEDYNYCRRTFIQPGVHCDFSPERFQSEIQRNRVRLDDIFQIIFPVESHHIYTACLYYQQREYSHEGLRNLVFKGGMSPSSRENNQGWKMQPRDFQRNFPPSQNGRVYLLYEIRRRRRAIQRNWCSNNHEQHAEINFLENRFNNRPQTPCSITWFLSSSPCGNCSRRILEFLRSHPNVTLDIYAARLFRPRDFRNRQGLRNLMMYGVAIRIMNLEDYRYCWRNFVAHQPGEDDYWPQNVTLCFILNSIELLHIFLGLPPFLAN